MLFRKSLGITGLVMICTIALNLPVAAYQYSLAPIDDDYVSQIFGNPGIHGLSYLRVSNSSTDISNAYLRFPLAQIPLDEEIVEATLCLYAFAGYFTTMQLHHLSFDGWAEDGISWDSQPSSQGTVTKLDSVFVGYTPETVELDLLKNMNWLPDQDIEDGYLSLMLSTNSGVLLLASEEFPDHQKIPRLSIHTSDSSPTTPVPIPSSLHLLASGMILLCRRISRRKR